MRVEVVDAGSLPVRRIEIELAEAATIAEVLAEAGVVVPSGGAVAVAGRLLDGDSRLSDGDRVEVCAPLKADPKQARRARARRSALS